MKKFLQFLPSVLFFVLLLFFWETIVDLFNINPQLLPAPSVLISVYTDHALILIPHILQTILETIIGLLLAIILGVLVAIALRLSSLVRKALYPLIIVSQTIPV